MTLTPLFLTGFEHGLISANGLGLFDAVTGSPTASTSAGTFRNGAYGLQGTGSSPAFVKKTIPGSPTSVTTRFAAKITARPSAGNFAQFFGFFFLITVLGVEVDSNGQLSLNSSTGPTRVTGPTIDTTNWHLIEVQYDGVNGVARWRVDGVPQTQVTVGANGVTQIEAGLILPGGGTPTVNIDDVIAGSYTNAATDWWGDGKVLAQVAGSDGTHTTQQDFAFGDAGAAFASTPAVTNANTKVADAAPWTATRSTTDNLSQLTTGTSAFLEIAPATTSQISTANGVQAIIAYSPVSNTACTAACIIRNSAGTAVTLLGSAGSPVSWLTDATPHNFFKSAQATTPVAGWTSTEVNAVRWRFGYSNDISPRPTLQALMLEVDWPAGPGYAYPTGAAKSAVTALLTAISQLSLGSVQSLSAATTLVKVLTQIGLSSSSKTSATALVTSKVLLSPTSSSKTSAVTSVTASTHFSISSSSKSSSSSLVFSPTALAPHASSTSSSTSRASALSLILPHASSNSSSTSKVSVLPFILPHASSNSSSTSRISAQSLLSPNASSNSSSISRVSSASLISPVSLTKSRATEAIQAKTFVTMISTSKSSGAMDVGIIAILGSITASVDSEINTNITIPQELHLLSQSKSSSSTSATAKAILILQAGTQGQAGSFMTVQMLITPRSRSTSNSTMVVSYLTIQFLNISSRTISLAVGSLKVRALIDISSESTSSMTGKVLSRFLGPSTGGDNRQGVPFNNKSETTGVESQRAAALSRPQSISIRQRR